MRAVFVHDHTFIRDDDGNVYTTGSLNAAVWKRYLNAFDSLHVIGRISEANNSSNKKQIALSTTEKVSFSFAPNLAKVCGRHKALSDARRIIRSELIKADALIARCSELSRLAVCEARKLNLPYAVEVVGCSWDAYWNHGSFLGKLYAPAAFVKNRNIVRNAKYAIYVSEKFLQNRYPCKGVTEYASNVELSSPPEDVLEHRLIRCSTKEHIPVLGTIGSLTCKYKGIHVAFKALADLKKEGSLFKYQILGNGDQTPWRNLAHQYGIEDDVAFCGTLPCGEPVLEWLDCIDIYLQPSFQEGLPRTVIEAMSRGCPCLASTAGGIPELLGKECLHRPGNARLLGWQIRHAVESNAWRIEQAERNFVKAKGYTKDIIDSRRNAFWQAFAEYAGNVRMVK